MFAHRVEVTCHDDRHRWDAAATETRPIRSIAASQAATPSCGRVNFRGSTRLPCFGCSSHGIRYPREFESSDPANARLDLGDG